MFGALALGFQSRAFGTLFFEFLLFFLGEDAVDQLDEFFLFRLGHLAPLLQLLLQLRILPG